jgi:pimeloyl-ACP methyl ester carboxylesterase
MKLRLYHHTDGARIAYRETGTGHAIVLLHSLGLSHREWEPIVESLAGRFRVVLPDLPLHGDSEDRPRHAYTAAWFCEVLVGFCEEVAGPRPLLVGHDFGAELALQAVATGALEPSRLVLAPNRLHRPAPFAGRRALWRLAAGLGAVPGLGLAVSHGSKLVFRPSLGDKLSARRNPEARDLIRHAFADVGGNANRARAWARFVRRWPFDAQRDLLDAYPLMRFPILLLWADEDPAAPIEWAQEALDLMPDAQLRTVPGVGFLIAYDDPVTVAREIIWFCG